jgi:hypothetical protein
VSPLFRVAVREPGYYRDSGEPPLLPEAPAWQIALFCATPDSLDWELEKGGSLLEREHLVSAQVRSACDLII